MQESNLDTLEGCDKSKVPRAVVGCKERIYTLPTPLIAVQRNYYYHVQHAGADFLVHAWRFMFYFRIGNFNYNSTGNKD